jgi:hypothetical protein
LLARLDDGEVPTITPTAAEARRRRPTHQPSWTPGCAPYRALVTVTLALARDEPRLEDVHLDLASFGSRRPLRRVLRRALPSGARRARRRVLGPARVERRPPAAFVVLRQLEVVALARHADRDPANAGPGVEPGAESPQGAGVGRAREPDEAECCSQESAAAVEHALLDDLSRLQQH